MRRTLLIAIFLVSFSSVAQTAQAERPYAWLINRNPFRFLEQSNESLFNFSKKSKVPFHTFDREYYNTRYPFNRYYSQQGHSFNGYPKYNR